MPSEKKLQLREVTASKPLKISFVCLGNICRSPTAEGVFQHLVNKEGLSDYFEIDSAGTGAWHVGEPANSKSRMTAEKHGISLDSTARKFEPSDLEQFDLILAMDRQNFHDLESMDPNRQHRDKFFLLREFDPIPDNKEVPDPYYGGLHGFELVFEIVMRSCEALLNQVKPHIRQ